MIVERHEPSIKVAKELTKGVKASLKKYQIIIEYISRNFRYDYIRAIQIARKKVKPDIARTWETRMGVCQDISAMTTGMLRAIGIDAKMCVGKADGRRHAWVESVINGMIYLYDHEGKAMVYKAEKKY